MEIEQTQLTQRTDDGAMWVCTEVVALYLDYELVKLLLYYMLHCTNIPLSQEIS